MTHLMHRVIGASFILVVWAGAAAAADKPAAALDTAAIERLTGAKGTLDAKEGVFKVSMPRADIAATVGGARMTPPLGLTAWAAFTKAGTHTMVMGDIVLLEDQVNPVMSAALDAGLDVTALHNHFFWDTPKVMFMHMGGMGDEAALATACRARCSRGSRRPAAARARCCAPTSIPRRRRSKPEKIEAVLRHKGELKDGVYKVVIGRTTKMGGHDGRQGDGREHLGRVRGQRREGDRRRRLRDAGVGAAAAC